MHVRIATHHSTIFAGSLPAGTLLEINWRGDGKVAYLKTADRFNAYIRLDNYLHADSNLCDREPAKVLGRLVVE